MSVEARERAANLVDTDFHQSDERGEQGAAGDNVVRLPRDWLGPREELIPFGPAAYAAEDEGRGDTGNAPTAHDFWGGEDFGFGDRAGDDGAAGSDQPRVGVRGLRVGAREFRFPGAGARAPTRTRLLSISLLGLAVAAVLTTLMLRGVTQGPSRRGLLAARTAQVAARPGSGSAARSAGSQPVRGHSVIASKRQLGKRSGHSSRAASRRRGGHRGRRGAAPRSGAAYAAERPAQTPTPAAQPVGYTSPPSAPSGVATTPPPSPAPSHPTATVSRRTPDQASSAKQPVWGQNGSLGPGHGDGTG